MSYKIKSTKKVCELDIDVKIIDDEPYMDADADAYRFIQEPAYYNTSTHCIRIGRR